MNSEELLISITSNLSKVENDLRALSTICEYESKRNNYTTWQRQLKDINGEILKDLDSVYNDENYTGTLDKI